MNVEIKPNTYLFDRVFDAIANRSTADHNTYETFRDLLLHDTEEKLKQNNLILSLLK